MFATIDRRQRPAPVVMLLRTGLYHFAGLRLHGAGGLKGCASPPLVLWLGCASLPSVAAP